MTTISKDLAKAKQAAKARTLERINAVTRRVLSEYADGEAQSWTKKEVAATAMLAGQADAEQTAFLQIEADIVGETVTDLSTRVVASAQRMNRLAPAAAGLRRAAAAAIDAATTVAQVDARERAAATQIRDLLGSSA